MNLQLKSIKEHWDSVYRDTPVAGYGWFQPVPEMSLRMIEAAGLSIYDRIIDVGGGDSLLADHLLSLGFKDITVLDISEQALDRAKKRLGRKSEEITWICQDITDFKPLRSYDLWHDRACFHFLTDPVAIEDYLSVLREGISKSGTMIMGTFSRKGPKKCSGLEIKQYDENDMRLLFGDLFSLTRSCSWEHITPVQSIQNYIYCTFIKK
jgi:2-polyprenyl-3-methyl-5-hydroxy-6-metoxy-1,4-benzoquinol methylase